MRFWGCRVVAFPGFRVASSVCHKVEAISRSLSLLTYGQDVASLSGSCAASAKRSLAAQMVPSTGCKMLVYLVSFTPKTHLVPFRGPRTPSLIYGERIALYLVPPARSRYCASPEASVMRLKAAAKLGATAGAPTQHSYKLQHY